MAGMGDTDSPVLTETELPHQGVVRMRAFVVEKYGRDGLRAAEVSEPSMGPRDVLVHVRGASINPLDKMVRNGEFKLLLKYKPPFVLGHDVAGVVVRVGNEVQGFKVGDEVYARPRDGRIGAFAERIAIHEDDVALKPKSLTARTRPLTTRRRRSRSASRATTSCSILWAEIPSPGR